MIIFVDETHYYENVNSGTQFVGTGILVVSDIAFVDASISEAFQLLEADPDIHDPITRTLDQRTLNDRYFHACEDSKNAHSAICNGINHNLVGDFYFNYGKSDFDLESALQQTFEYVGIKVCTSRKPVLVYIEERTSFSPGKARLIINKVFDAIEFGVYDYCGIPTFFPEFIIEFVDKSNKGVQLADFIMWSKNRSRTIPPKDTWEKRLIFSSKSDIGQVGGEFDMGNITFKKGVKQDLHIGIYPQSAFPLGEFHSNRHIEMLFQYIDEKVKDFLLNDTDLPHIRIMYSYLVNFYVEAQFIYSDVIISRIGSCYIRIFDMKPIYSEADKQNIPKFKDLLQSKRLAGLSLRKDLVNGVRTAQYLAKCMRALKAN